MNINRRSFSATPKSAGKFNGKLKEVPSSSLSKHRLEPKIVEMDFENIPLIRQTDNVRLLPKYSSILAKSGEDTVIMEDLDQLQQDLEKLLSMSAVRTRFFLGEITNPYKIDDRQDRKAHDKTSLKRKKPDDKQRCKDVKNGMRVIKKHCLPNKFYNENLYQEIPKITLPRNDNSDKFWASIEPYCAPVNKDDVAFLDGLIQEFSKEIEIKIPNVGEHYAKNWTEEIINDEQYVGKSPSKKNAANDIKKMGLHALVESFSTPSTQRLLSALIQENVLKNSNIQPKNGENGKISKVKPFEFAKLKQNSNQKLGTCLDKRLMKELVEQGVLKAGDLAKNTAPEDEILAEIKKCQQELVTVNEYNVEELNKLKSAFYKDIHLNNLKEELDKVDFVVLDLYNSIIIARKNAHHEDGDEFDKEVFSEQITQQFEHQADALLKQQIFLNQEINGLTDMSMLY